MKYDRMTSLLLLAFAILFCVQSYQLGMGSLRDPGRGFIPFLSGVLLAGLSIAIFLRSILKGEQPSTFGKGWKRGVWAVGGLFIYILILERLGFIVTTFLFLILTLLSIEPGKWKSAFLVSLFTVIISYLVFSVWLKVQLPTGFLGI